MTYTDPVSVLGDTMKSGDSFANGSLVGPMLAYLAPGTRSATIKANLKS